MAGLNDNTNIAAPVGSVVDNDEEVSPGAAKSTGNDSSRGPLVLREILQDLERSEEGEKEARMFHKWIDPMIEDLRRHGMEGGLDMRDDRNRTLLHFAAIEGLPETAKRLIDAGVTLDAQDEWGDTPLIDACGEGDGGDGYVEVAKLLLEKGSKANIFNNENESSLYKAAINGHRHIVRHLLDKVQWDLDVGEDAYGVTPLHAAASGNDSEIVQYLRDKGAKLHLRDTDGWTPLMTATASRSEVAMKELLRRRRKEEEEDLQLETEDSEGRTPILRAAKEGFLNGFRLLMEAGANMNAVDRDGQQPLHLASLQGNKAILELVLCTQGCNQLYIDNDAGTTPLHLACTGDDYDGQYNEVIQLLLNQNPKHHTEAERKEMENAVELAFDYDYDERGEAILAVLAEESSWVSDTLLRAAGMTKTHKIAASLLKRQLKDSATPDAEKSGNWTAIEWAAYARKPQTLWLLIASSPQSKETKNVLKSAKALIEKSKKKGKVSVNNPGNQEADQTGGAKKNSKESKRQEIEDILTNPPVGLMCRDNSAYPPLKCEDRYSSDNFNATVVQFYKTQGKFESIMKSQNIKETIYGPGPANIMHKMEDTLKRLADSHLKGLDTIQRPLFIDSRPQTGPQFTWIHLPATNIAWMDHLLQRIMDDGDEPVGYFNQAKSFFKDSWTEIPDSLSESRIMRPRFVSRDTKGTGSLVAATAIYIPFLSYSFQCVDTPPRPQMQIEKRPVKTKKTRRIENSTAVQSDVESKRKKRIENQTFEEEMKSDYVSKLSQSRKRYQRLLDEYSSSSIIHESSTLHESHYHFGTDDDSSKDKDRRNRSQVVTESWLRRRAQRMDQEREMQRRQEQQWQRRDSQAQQGSRRERREEQEQENINHTQKLRDTDLYWLLLRVNQLWIWTINDRWLISASSHPIDDSEDELLNGILDRLERQREAGGSDSQPGSAGDMGQFIVDYCIDSYERAPKLAHYDERPEDCKLKNFPSIRQVFLQSLSYIERNGANLFDHFSELRQRLRNRSRRSMAENNEPSKSLDDQLAEATSEAEHLSRRVRDILDELSMLQATLQYQEDVQKAMRKKQTASYNKVEYALETDITATHNINDIKRLTIIAERILATIDNTLSLHQSEIANLQAGLAMQEGRVLMVFTVVTILFLPMSFLISLFALDVASFQQAPPWALCVIFGASAVIFIIMVIFAFTWERSKAFVLGQISNLLPHAVSRALKYTVDKAERFIRGLFQLTRTSNRRHQPEHWLFWDFCPVRRPRTCQS